MPTVAHRACRLSAWGLIVVLAGGCANIPPMPWDEPDVVPGIVPPGERVAELRKLRADAGRASAEHKELVVAGLAEQIVQETDASLRAEIVRTLAVYPTDQSKRILRHALEDVDRHVRIAACEAWGKIPHPEAVSLLGETLQADTDIDVRLAAAKALGRTRDSQAAAALAPALADADPAMQYRATLSLRQVTGKNFGTIAAWRQYLHQANTPESRPAAVADRPWDAY